MTSDAGDPHHWMFDCEVVCPVPVPVPRIKAWWVCRRCGTVVRVSSDVVRSPHSGNEAYDEMAALSRLHVKANAARRDTHPRCSEVRAVKEVMGA